MLIVLGHKDPYELQALQAGLVAPDREVLILPDGENIVTIAQSRSPDVVIVSQSLGQMGGFAVSRELKMLADVGAIPEPKVVVLLERAADAWLARWSRCDAYVLAPHDSAEIDAVVRGLVTDQVA